MYGRRSSNTAAMFQQFIFRMKKKVIIVVAKISFRFLLHVNNKITILINSLQSPNK